MARSRSSATPSPQSAEIAAPAASGAPDPARFAELDNLEAVLVMLRDVVGELPRYHVKILSPAALGALSGAAAFALSAIESGKKYRGALN